MVRHLVQARQAPSMRPAACRAVVSVRWAVTGVRRFLDALPASLLAIVLAFHAWLLFTSISSGRVLDLDVATRWVAGLVLSGAFLGCWRRGVPLRRGRKAVVLWVLVAVLHAHAVASAPASLGAHSPVAETLVALAAQLGAPLAAAIGVALLAFGARVARQPFRRRLVLVLTSDTLAHVRAGGICFVAPRPPPLVA